MSGTRRRTRVLAEITVAHIKQLAIKLGFPASEDDVLTFLNEDGHAYAMWMHMMQAGEEFIKSELPGVFSKADPTQSMGSTVAAYSSCFPACRTATDGMSDLSRNLRI
jgi:hypothetical protein